MDFCMLENGKEYLEDRNLELSRYTNDILITTRVEKRRIIKKSTQEITNKKESCEFKA